MVWSHYRDEANLITENEPNNQINDSLEQYSGKRVQLDFDDWVTWYSDDLHNIWSSINSYTEYSFISSHFLNFCDFNDFCEFCYNMSSKEN